MRPFHIKAISARYRFLISHPHASYHLSVWASSPLWLRHLVFGPCEHQERTYCHRSGCYLNSYSIHSCRRAVYWTRFLQVGFGSFLSFAVIYGEIGSDDSNGWLEQQLWSSLVLSHYPCTRVLTFLHSLALYHVHSILGTPWSRTLPLDPLILRNSFSQFVSHPPLSLSTNYVRLLSFLSCFSYNT